MVKGNKQRTYGKGFLDRNENSKRATYDRYLPAGDVQVPWNMRCNKVTAKSPWKSSKEKPEPSGHSKMAKVGKYFGENPYTTVLQRESRSGKTSPRIREATRSKSLGKQQRKIQLKKGHSEMTEMERTIPGKTKSNTTKQYGRSGKYIPKNPFRKS